MNIKIGNTPMIKIKYEYKGKEDFVFSKLESYNITGSIKDRVAFYMINKAYEKGILKKGMKIVEATSGNTGIALAAIGRYFENPVHIFMPDWVSKERFDLMKMYNAEITLVSKKEGGFKNALEKAKRYARENDAFLTNQFSNENNILAHYETTGKEIIEKIGNNIGGFVSGIGTGGTLMGVGRRLKEFDKNIKIYALEPDKMPILSQNKIIGNHKIEGIGDDFIPEIVNKDIIDFIYVINDDDSINMSRRIALDLGIGVGISSGANMIASVLAKESNNKKIITVFPDDNKKYLSTELVNPIDENPNYISNKIKLLDYEFVADI
ncbi:MAG: cysteine synthase family protein [Clostridia bacterium]|nr:cysteine synthase family protein [Clostridia bacterium]